MLDQNLVNYVKKAFEQGHDPSAVRQALLANGWNEADVDQAISLLKMQSQAPVAPGAAPKLTPTATVHRNPYAGPVRPQYYSYYSQLLAIVLFVFLLILVNNIISDVRDYFADNINTSLVFDALLIVPFLLAATLLHIILSQKQEKFLIISYPYYVVSGWLIVRLLWRVSEYILSTNATYGVYIVLIMVIAVLTGIVFFIQKFIKHKGE